MSETENDHTAIEAKVRAALHSEPALGPGFHLKRVAFGEDGCLLLEGEVPSVAAKKLALESAAAVSGVAGIVDRLRVTPAVPMNDGEIRVHVRDAFVGELAFASLEIRELDAGAWRLVRGAPEGRKGTLDIEVQDGIVTLNGRVPGLTSKRLAGVLAWWVPGVRDVVNGIEADPPEEDSPGSIEEAVRVALEKDPLVNASQIRVGVRNTVVRLTGAVPAAVERDAAGRDAWCILGVDKVLNEIEVKP